MSMTGWLTACGRIRAAFATGALLRCGGLLQGVVMAVIVAFPAAGMAAPQDTTTLRSLDNIEVSQLPPSISRRLRVTSRSGRRSESAWHRVSTP